MPHHTPRLDRDDLPASPAQGDTFAQIAAARLTRRGFLGVMASALGAACATPSGGADPAPDALAPKPDATSTLRFAELAHGRDAGLHVSPGHEAQVVIRWGDPVLPGALAFNPQQQRPEDQARQFGMNNDHIAWFSLPPGSEASDHGLLAINHEYSEPPLMFPGSPRPKDLDRAQMEVDLLANGMSIIEVKRGEDRQWRVVEGSAYARRITPRTPVRFEGPAAGHTRMQTNDSPDGRAGLGTFGGCAGGVTPWGTVLTAEENVDTFFLGSPTGSAEAAGLARFGYKDDPDPMRGWGLLFPRFDVQKSTREINHFGWIVEIDPYDPSFVPRKRTALGRIKHEGCGLTVDKATGRVVGYMGDDQKFEYIYKFVSKNSYKPNDRAANLDLLNEGTLYAAKFEADGVVRWLPLVFGEGPLTTANGFDSQGEVVIDARRAADLLGATRMDRPEDIEVNPVTGVAYVMLTRNEKRKEDERDAANPRARNIAGHIVELTAPGGDHTALEARWDFLLMAGDPDAPDGGARYHEGISKDGWFVAPDNCAFDRSGRLWVTTDTSMSHDFADGIWACDVQGPGRALTRHFLRAPVGAEVTGPCFTPDNTTFFCSIQHPGEESTFDAPSTRWPDFQDGMPPRAAVVAVSRTDGAPIG
jgi:secreted PhoX family phosphatase